MKRKDNLFFTGLLFFILALLSSCGTGADPSPEAPSGKVNKSVASPASFKIAGSINHGASGLYGATVTLAGAAAATATTNASGEFSFTGLNNGSYAITPSKAGFAFDSINIVRTINNADISSVNFSATPLQGALNKLSGIVTSDNAPLAGVTLTLGGASGAVVSNDASGNFSIETVPDGTYSLSASKPGYVFFPASVAVVVKGADISGINFAGAPVEGATHGVTGRISFNTIGLAGVIVKISGPVTGAVVTDARGNFTIHGLPNGGYTVNASKTGYVFSPMDKAIDISGTNAVETNFTAIGPSYAITGRAHLAQCNDCNVQGVTMTLNTTPPISVMTGTNGAYAFKDVPNGSYTVTPDMRSGASIFLPRSSVVNVNNANAQNADFGVSTVQNVSGQVGYTGAKTGRVYVWLRDTGSAATHQSGASIVSTGAYIVRGVPPGNYQVCAWMDNLGSGRRNSANPSGCSDIFSVITSPVAGVNITLTDAAWPLSLPPAFVNAVPYDAGALVTWPPYKVNGVEAAQSYNIYYSTSAAGALKGVGTRIANVPAIDDGHYFVSGLAPNESYYFTVTSVVNGVESAEASVSSVSGPVKAAAPVGEAVISGSVTFQGAARGPLYVGYYGSEGRIYIAKISNPVSPVQYSISGVLPGVYVPYAFIDSDNSGTISPGDARNNFQNGIATTITVEGNTANNIEIGADKGSVAVATSHWSDGANENYSIRLIAGSGEKNIVSAVIEEGVNLPTPLDLANQGGYYSLRSPLGGVAPMIGDAYAVRLSYADGSAETRYVAVNGVLNSFAAPMSPVGGARGQTTPTFRWAAPENLPSIFIYNVEVVSLYTGLLWRTNDNAIGLPGTVNSVVYNFDNSALDKSLVPGTPHFWEISVTDETGNMSLRQAGFTP